MSDDNNYFFGYIGVASALIFANLGAAYGSAKAGVGICSMGVLKPELIMKSVVPVVMAGILGIYGMIVAVIIVQKSTTYPILVPATGYKANAAYAHLASGLCCGFSSLVIKSLIEGGRIGDRYCGRRGCAGERTTGQDLRGNDFDIDFRRSPGIVRSYRIFDSHFAGLKTCETLKFLMMNKFMLDLIGRFLM
jgi:V-type H+-transporting ATPase proteolipid subunit